MLRFFSILTRKLKSRKKEIKLLKQFNVWKEQQQFLQNDNPTKKLLIIRLDDIGDYILFRNFLQFYKISERWKSYSLTLLGNIVWKDLFEKFDASTVDNIIWVDKKQYLNNEEYRKRIWVELHNQNFEIVICPSRTRPLLLDDLCAIATGANKMIASENTFVYASWNALSDSFYIELFVPDNIVHEFYYNRSFTSWCCEIDISIIKPEININKIKNPDIICFIGASAKSKRWIAERWIELINLIEKEMKYDVFIAGGNADITMADKIASSTNAKNIAGKTSLNEIINLIANANSVITNDTIAAHAAVACNTPAVIIANGNNYYRFTDYSSFNLKNVITIYPEIFFKQSKTKKTNLLHYDAVSSDIQTISVKDAFNSLQKVLL